MSNNNHINYIEFKFRDLEETKAFYSAAFDWEFTYYGQIMLYFQVVVWMGASRKRPIKFIT